MVAEGTSWTLDRSLETTAVYGDLTATVDWNDGTATNVAVEHQQTLGSLVVDVDYSLDRNGFFNVPSRRTLIEKTLQSVASRLTDTLTAISPSGSNTWSASFLDPGNGSVTSKENLSMGQNRLRVFVGGYAMNGPLAIGGGGGFQVGSGSSQAFKDAVKGRGQSGALLSKPTDVAPWGGSIAFNTSIDWYFGEAPPPTGNQQFDFVSTVAHEFMHSLGIGTTTPWDNLVVGGTFTGPRSVEKYDGPGNVPLSADLQHWADGTTDAGQPSAMDKVALRGVRVLPNPLDYAGLDDIGWNVAYSSARLTINHTYPDNGTYAPKVTLTGSNLGAIATTASVSVTNVAPSLENIATMEAERDLPLKRDELGKFSDPGFDAPSRTPPSKESFPYTINWGDGSKVDQGIATIKSAGKAGQPTLGTVAADHTFDQVGTFFPSIEVRDDDGGVATKSFRVNVVLPRVLVGVSPDRVAENAGAKAVRLTIDRRELDLSAPLEVRLSATPDSGLILPATVTLAAGQQRTTIFVGVTDNTVRDGTRSHTITARAPNYSNGQTTLVVIDNESAPYQNPGNPLDVSDNGRIEPQDALQVINAINAGMGGSLDPSKATGLPPFFDVSGDDFLAPLDALRVINHLNANGNGEGEGKSRAVPSIPIDPVAADAFFASAMLNQDDSFAMQEAIEGSTGSMRRRRVR
jgi:hypothetical protein